MALLGGCSDAVRVSAPATTGAAGAQCRALQAQLPRTLMGRERRGTDPASADTAAWGDPAITLRCGVPEPGPMNPASPQYDPHETQSVMIESSGLCWLTQSTNGGGYVFTTVKQQTFVEVDVPGAYAGQNYPLPELAGPLRKTDPASTDPGVAFDCS